MFGYIFWNPSREILRLPFLPMPLSWYGLLFALGFLCAYWIFIHIAKKEQLGGKALVESFSLHMVLGTVIGARLGHILFYENVLEYLRSPLSILKTWEGGLASHGAVIGILIAILLFCRKWKEVSFWRLLDALIVPGAFVGAFIRVGNFVNQEILGKASTLPWAVIFGQPADGSAVIPRHPVQLYEALFYLSLSGIFYWLWRKKSLKESQLSGLFLIVLFSFRFLIEFLKLEQSHLLEGSYLVMGQYLSLPMIGLGIYLMQRAQRSARAQRE